MSEILSLMTDEDKHKIREMVAQLPQKKNRAVHLRFWENHTIDEIASKLRISWAEANRLIDETIEDLRKMFFESEKEVDRQRS